MLINANKIFVHNESNWALCLALQNYIQSSFVTIYKQTK